MLDVDIQPFSLEGLQKKVRKPYNEGGGYLVPPCRIRRNDLFLLIVYHSSIISPGKKRKSELERKLQPHQIHCYYVLSVERMQAGMVNTFGLLTVF